MLSYDHQGGGGLIMYNINVLDEPEVLQPVVPRIIPTKFSRWPKSTTNKISSLRLIMFDVFCGVNPIEPSLLVLNKWMEHGNTSKNGDLCRCYTKKTTSVQKKDTLGPTAGHGVTMSPSCSLWLLRCRKHSGTEASRRGKNWMSECRPDMIRMIENHRFLICFDPWRAKSSHRAGETQIFILESHACQSKWMSMLQTFFDDSCKYHHFAS